MESNRYLSIGEVSRMTGVHIKSLRYYDQIGVLKPAYVNPDTRYRFYTHSQLVLLDTIQVCIELGIPLKELPSFVGDNGEKIHYAKLLAYGKRLAQKKIRAIREGLRLMDAVQQDIERMEMVAGQADLKTLEYPQRRYYLEPLACDQSAAEVYKTMHELYIHTQERGHKPGYETGLLYCFKATGVDRYVFCNIMNANRRADKNTVTLPAGEYYVNYDVASRIEQTPTVFPELFQTGAAVVAVEVEPITGIYQATKPIVELRGATLPDGVV